MLEKFVVTSQRGRIYKLFACFPNILSVFVVLVKLIESAVYCYYKINLNFFGLTSGAINNRVLTKQGSCSI